MAAHIQAKIRKYMNRARVTPHNCRTLGVIYTAPNDRIRKLPGLWRDVAESEWANPPLHRRLARLLGHLHGRKHGRFQWLTPPAFAGSLTVANIAQAPAPPARAELAGRYVEEVWSNWSENYTATIATWYDKFVVPD